MSRTIRRKNHERTLLKQTRFFHEFGFYAERYYDREYRTVNDNYVIMFREPTKDERFKTWKEYHGESSDANARTPGRFFRRMYERKLRTHNNSQLRKAMSYNNFDGMLVYNVPASHMWAWD